MPPLALAFLALVCSIFGKASEATNHGHNINFDELYEGEIHGTIPKLAHLYGNHKDTANTNKQDAKDGYEQPNRWRHFNLNAKNDIENDDDHEARIHKNNKLSNVKNKINNKTHRMRQYNVNARRKRETNTDPRCQPFTFVPDKKLLTHPKAVDDLSKPGEGTYSSNITCFTTIEADEGQQVELTFIDVFELEYHPECRNDYLEIRNGRFGYATPVYRYCGNTFPPTFTSNGPYTWLKFHSDESIEYAGFTIEINYPSKGSKAIPAACYKIISGNSGVINGTSTSTELQTCRDSTSGPLDVQWKIETKPGTQIYLNITKFQLANANNCSKNTVQIFGAEPNFDHLLGEYCSSVAKSLWTEQSQKIPGPANIMYIRFFTTARASNFSAEYTQFRTAESCTGSEYDCKDATCIDKSLRCDGTAHCRLKADEDPVECTGEAQSLVRDKDTRTILIVFSLILSGMISVFLFKCIKKFYLDQKQINEHGKQMVDYLNHTTSQLTLNQKPRGDSRNGSLEHQNFANERNRQTHQHQRSQSSSVDSDLLRVPVDDDWLEREPIMAEDIRLQYKGRPMRDLSGKEDLLRGKGSKEEESRAVSAKAQELQEVECQTRESLYQTEPITPRTNVPGSKSATSQASVASPSPAPAPAPTPQLTVELLRQATAPNSSQADGRPLSSETTKSAPDVIQIY